MRWGITIVVLVLLVGEAGGDAGARHDVDLVARGDEALGAAWRDGHAVLGRGGFAEDSDAHEGEG